MLNNPDSAVKIKEMLKERRHFLINLQTQITEFIRTAPVGRIRIYDKNGQIRTYHRTSPSDKTGTYLSQKDTALKKQLVQKEYYLLMNKNIIKELASIDVFLKHCPSVTAEDAFSQLSDLKKTFAVPYFETDEMFLHTWETQSFSGKAFPDDYPEFLTARGERVRSKSEILIADFLFQEGIPYRYECPLHLNGYGTIYPDFTVLNIQKRKELYWEHFGMMDEPEYAQKAVKKISLYRQNGISENNNLILSFETKNTPLNRKELDRIVKDYL